ncbi:MFS transporter [Carboxydothermus hydrogenoformans]|uniref:Drug resistance transporter, EmrB/QacA family protein n=1 Tax=Carboxydothermus hydrogenoformans (strain ATCC BAA-161 / DSM 6008 / Z-2901) TaxID=246194 RepID=Q3AEJ0_CARHZ|nr:DHA2 family efflux MFS transporter permease subunit [Carboxydothermus hydrogenoformans]ABB13668.1 drug resistance transporter, EmrB/QacA family protein [Carboxydothermus hydrogenoformans Z-2901]
MEYRWRVMWVVALGTFMAPLDASVVNIALLSIIKDFKASLATGEWVILIYLLFISTLLLTYGRLGDLYGKKLVYVTGFVVFTVGSLLCGLSPTLGFLIGARVIQSLGAGMMMAMAPAIVTEVFPSQERGKALGINGMMVAAALAFGPSAGGFLTHFFGWRSVFFINLPIGLIGSILAFKIIKNDFTREKHSFDFLGAFLSFLGLGSLLILLTFFEKYGFTHPLMIGALVISILAFLLFLYTEKKVSEPMVDLGLFKNRDFSFSNLSAFLSYVALYQVVFLMPIYLQQLRHFTPEKAGMVMSVHPLLTMIVAPLSGSLSDKIGSKVLAPLGMTVMALGLFALSRLNSETTVGIIILSLMLIGLGSAIFQSPNNSTIMGSVPKNRLGTASGFLATMRNVGMVMGVAVAGAVFTGRRTYYLTYYLQNHYTKELATVKAFVLAFREAFLVGAFIALLSAAASLVRSRGRKEKLLQK